MAAELILAPEAEQDIQQAYDWYELSFVGVPKRFTGTRWGFMSEIGELFVDGIGEEFRAH